MATANDLLKVAAGEIGYYAPNDPQPGSKYGRWMAELTGESWLAGPSTSIWWCMIFVSWCFAQVDMNNVPGLPNYNTDDFKSKAKSIRVNKYDAKPGDIVLFDWGKDGATDHVGIVELNCGDYIQTIEGNTSGSNAGSQSAGNGVWRRTRAWSTVDSVYRPNFEGVTMGWKKDNNGWWYQYSDGSYPKSGWQKLDGKWYYFNSDGYAKTGWLKDGGKWYYLYKENDGGVECAMATNTWIQDGKKHSYLQSDGVAACDQLLTIDGKVYGFDKSCYMYSKINDGALSV